MSSNHDAYRNQYGGYLRLFLGIVPFFRDDVCRVPSRFCQIRPLCTQECTISNVTTTARQTRVRTCYQRVFRCAFRCNDFQDQRLSGLQGRCPLKCTLFLSGLTRVTIRRCPSVHPILICRRRAQFGKDRGGAPLRLRILHSFLCHYLVTVRENTYPKEGHFLRVEGPLLLS